MAEAQAGTPKRKMPVGRPFQKGADPRRATGQQATDTAEDFSQLARRIITDRRAQRALLRRAQAGDLPAHVIALLASSAAPAPPPPARTAPTTKEVADVLTAELPAYYQHLLYSYWKGRLDDKGNPTALARGTGARRHGAGVPKKAEEKKPAPEPDLAEDQPLAAASERLAAQEREARQRERSEAVTLDLSKIPDPEPTREVLPAAGRAPRGEHDHLDREHRAECRRCRATWRRSADGAEGPGPLRPTRAPLPT